MLRANRMRTESGPRRVNNQPGGGAFEARAIEAIDFISYRSDLTGEIRCGPRTPPDHVYVTWRPAPSSARGMLVAIEFLPR